MRNHEAVLVVGVMLAALAGPAVAGSAAQNELPIGNEIEVSHYNQCDKIGSDQWRCTTCVGNDMSQQTVCKTRLTNNPSPNNP